MAASMKDVAKRAGVSISTVSRILNGSARVDAEKEKAVREAIAYYRYEPNQFGRGLVKQCSRMIGIYLLSGVALLEPVYNLELLRGIEDVLCQQDYSLVLLTDKPGAAEPCFYRYIRENRIDGLVVSGLSVRLRQDAEFLRLMESGYPVTYIGQRFHETGMNIYAQFVEYHVDMVQRLFRRGHRRILILCSRMHDHYREAIRQAVAAALPQVRLRLLEPEMLDYEALSREIFGAVTEAHFTAACCPDIRSAERLFTICAQLGLSVPGQLSVVAVEHRPGEGLRSSPAISAVGVPARAMGRAAAEQLLAALSGQEVNKSVAFQAEYTERASVEDAPTNHLQDGKE